MKLGIIRIILLLSIFVMLISAIMPLTNNNIKIFTLPGLPRPIAKEPVIITSAGQSTDIYIINDISNRLMIRSYFMPQAEDTDLMEAKTIVFVVGHSPLGLKLQNKSYEDEKIRIGNLIDIAKDNDMTVLTIVMGGEKSHDNETEELLSLILPKSDYLIGLRKSGYENIIAQLAVDSDIQLTLVAGVDDIFEPFASAFR